MTLTPGQRVRLKGSPWPERAGAEGVIVAPRGDGIYPQPAKWEVLVLLDAEPIERRTGKARWWSCVISAKDVEAI